MVVYYVVQITCVGQPFCLSSLYGITLYSVTILRTASESVAAPSETPAEQRSMLMYKRMY